MTQCSCGVAPPTDVAVEDCWSEADAILMASGGCVAACQILSGRGQSPFREVRFLEIVDRETPKTRQ